MSHGVHRYPRKKRPDLRSEERRERERQLHQEQTYNDSGNVSGQKARPSKKPDEEQLRALLELPQENLFYFLEKPRPA